MAGNTIGQLFRVTTFGESHGLALGCIVDGVPPGISLTEADLQHDLGIQIRWIKTLPYAKELILAEEEEA